MGLLFELGERHAFSLGGGGERGADGAAGEGEAGHRSTSWRSRLTAISQYFGSISMPMLG